MPDSQTKPDILIVDDNATNLKVVEAMVKRCGGQPTCVDSGTAAIEAVMDHDFDMVFMDIAMPGMNGHEATQAIRAMGGKYTDLPIIALTAQAMMGDEQACLDAGMNAYYAKPVKMALIQEAMDTWVKAHHQSEAGDAKLVQPSETIDANALEELELGVGRELMGELIDAYLGDAATRVENIESAMSNKDLDVLRDETHSLGSSSATYGALALFSLCREIEELIRAGDGSTALDKAKAVPALARQGFDALRVLAKQYPSD